MPPHPQWLVLQDIGPIRDKLTAQAPNPAAFSAKEANLREAGCVDSSSYNCPQGHLELMSTSLLARCLRPSKHNPPNSSHMPSDYSALEAALYSNKLGAAWSSLTVVMQHAGRHCWTTS